MLRSSSAEPVSDGKTQSGIVLPFLRQRCRKARRQDEQCSLELRRHIHATAMVRLRRRDHASHDVALHDGAPLLPIDVVPLERQQLAEPHTRTERAQQPRMPTRIKSASATATNRAASADVSG